MRDTGIEELSALNMEVFGFDILQLFDPFNKDKFGKQINSFP